MPNSNRGKILRPERTGSARGEQPALNVSSFSDDDLMELMVSNFNLDRAWRRVKRNRGAAGPDGMTIKETEQWLETDWSELRQQLLDL